MASAFDQTIPGDAKVPERPHWLRRLFQRQEAERVDLGGLSADGEPLLQVSRPTPESDPVPKLLDRIADLERQLAKADVRARYLTLGDLDAALKYAGVADGLTGVCSLGLDGPKGDMNGALEVIVHRYTHDAYGFRHYMAAHHEGATLGEGGPIAAETRRFLLRRDGGLDPR